MAARSAVGAWDNRSAVFCLLTGSTELGWLTIPRAVLCSTRGLDASTALDYAKSIRILTDVFRNTSFVSLYQAGEGIYNQFDKVLVIDEGRQVYFGPAKEARQYMVGLGCASRNHSSAKRELPD